MTYTLADHLKNMKDRASVTERPSHAIEVCLTAPFYWRDDEDPQRDKGDSTFMCNALISAGEAGVVSWMAKELAFLVIQNVMEKLSPHKHFGTMSNCLREWARAQAPHWSEPGSEPPHLAWMFADEATREPMMKQLYVWLVFDLKRKGL